MPELRRFSRRINPDERSRMIAESELVESISEVVGGDRGAGVSTDGFVDLFDEVGQRIDAGRWPDRTVSDRWLAPLLHAVLRLSRAQAADRATWDWLAMSVPHYVRWRWKGKADVVTEDRWYGPVHKQALARLWWGAELFRDGSDYGPARQAFTNQDLPNSLLHRPLVRCRPLAVGLVTVLLSNERAPTSAEVNDLARVVNLITAGSPPEAETGYHRDDVAGYRRWLQESAPPVANWDGDVVGPSVPELSEDARSAGRAIATRGQEYATRTQEVIR